MDADATVRPDRHGPAAGLARSPAGWVLAATLLALGGGAVARAASAAAAGDALWAAGGVVGALHATWSTGASLRRGRVGVDVVAVLALVGALAVGELLAAAVVAVMVATGRALETWAAGRARRDLHALLQRAPRVAHRYEGGGVRTVALDDVRPGDVLVVGPGEVVPVDGNLLTDGALDESALTGEALPVTRQVGDAVRSGVVNAGAALDLRTTTTAAASTYAGIVRLVADAEATPAPFVRLADRFALWFLALTVVLAGATWAAAGAARAVAVLVVATPCPLILAAPVALVAGLSRVSRRGVVVKGGGALERLARCTTLLVDKTGTLTGGRPELAGVVTSGVLPADEVLRLAGSLDQLSPHVLASAVVQAARDRGLGLVLPEDVEEVAGQGIRGVVDGADVALGNAAWTGVPPAVPWAKAARRRARLDGALTVFVSVGGRPAGVLVLDDPVRSDAARTVRSLRRSGIDRIVMVTGDRADVAETVGAVIGVDAVLAERSPADKLDAVRSERRRAPTVMVGDGINDAPALALADVGVAMGARGATASSEAADVVLTVDRLDRIGEARVVARRSRRIAVQSVVAGMGMSIAAMGVAAAGHLPAVWGAVLQEGIDVAAIANALRALGGGRRTVLAGGDAALARRFTGEHQAVRAALDDVRAAADAVGSAQPARAMALVREAHAALVSVVLPHEEAEQQELYPALDRVIGGTDPTGPMTRAHVEIAHQVRRLGQLVEEIGPGVPDGEEEAELRRLLYGLHAVLRLHTAQEEESYLSLGEDEPTPPAAEARRDA